MLDNLRQLERQSVQDVPNVLKGDSAVDMWGFTTQRGFILPAWGTRESERWLRWYYRNEYNWMGQSAFAGLLKKVASTQWEIKGRRKVSYFQDILRQADFGRGWASFIKKGVDFLRQDGGWYWEIIAPGNPMKAPTGAITGIAHLDSLRCYPTGDPEFPVIYYARKGKMHKMHYTRVRQIVDMPDGDESNPGYGLCALRRAISIVTQQLHMMRYIEGKLDDKPQPGYMVASGITAGQRAQAFATYTAEQSMDEMPAWGKTAWFFSLDPSQKIKLDPVSFSQAPEAYSYKEYTELHANAWALALGVDVQELWQLSGGNIGSAGQSEVLHAKSQGKSIADLYTTIERNINDLFPESLEFAFKQRDPLESQSEAATAQAWAGVATSVSTAMTDDEKRIMLASKVEAIKDAITDDQGEIVALGDIDPETPEQSVDDTVTPAQTMTTPAQTAQTQDSQKAAKATSLDFEGDFADLLSGARSGDVERRRFGIILRDLLRKYGLQAYQDGLTEGGVSELDEGDQAAYLALLAKQSAYVTGLGDEIYHGTGISAAQAAVRPQMWVSKSLGAFYDAGRGSANRNGMYEFTGDDGAESCKTCQGLKGQRHRFKWWASKQLRPRVDTENYICRGFNCAHKLTNTAERAYGRFSLN